MFSFSVVIPVLSKRHPLGAAFGRVWNGALFLGFSVFDFDRSFRLLSGSPVPLSVVEGLAHDRVPGHALDVDVGHEGVRSLSCMLRFLMRSS